jgi:hypothetical protein
MRTCALSFCTTAFVCFYPFPLQLQQLEIVPFWSISICSLGLERTKSLSNPALSWSSDCTCSAAVLASSPSFRSTQCKPLAILVDVSRIHRCHPYYSMRFGATNKKQSKGYGQLDRASSSLARSITGTKAAATMVMVRPNPTCTGTARTISNRLHEPCARPVGHRPPFSPPAGVEQSRTATATPFVVVCFFPLS